MSRSDAAAGAAAGALVLGVDVGTSSTKGVLVDLGGRIVRQAVREHAPSRPRPGHVEMDGALWWEEFAAIARELASDGLGASIASVGVSGMGPCILLTDEAGAPLRPAVLYGVDTRATEQIARLDDELGAEAILARGGSLLSSQAVGPKLAWLAEHEPMMWQRARRLFMPASWLAFRLTGAYRLDHHSASQCTPMYDTEALAWHAPWADPLRGDIELPELGWPEEVVGTLTQAAAAETGLPAGIPVALGTIDAWTEALSVGAHRPGDLMLMYGTTMFLIETTSERVTHPTLWGTVGSAPGTYSLAGGMATSGAITGWLRDLVGRPDWAELIAEAESSPPGSRGLLMLPYFAGERTPINDPDARGAVLGLTLDHGRGDLYRATLEATAFAVRHNVEEMRRAGAVIERIVAVGGGTQSALWPQIVSDVTGLVQERATVAVGASLGAAYLAARAIADVSIDDWNPIAHRVEPDPGVAARYDALYADYRSLYTATRDVAHRLARLQHDG
ncbi:FGGY-family carbohydrate kinase [Agrococcus sp. Marseille-P2731]|uniref:FGGY-family carbohydrate kinase n=1 Tax=Agrococcus sp. Marseille-P2731 TaxID=1841862 RepID=UPI00093129DF|nr:FGGY-family carbohydrate kinase [Agrococcus sp. Marseille-P2731]